MQLKKILKNVNTTTTHNRPIEIGGLAIDSRKVEADFLFAALPGTKVDGAKFIPEAIKRGAAAILTSEKTQTPDDLINDNEIEHIKTFEPHKSLSIMAANFYEFQPENICAITGTNGKTSIADFVRQIFASLGKNAASVGTLGVIADGYPTTPSLTTPDPITLHENLRDLHDRGVNYLALEASSHGLDQHRLDGVKIKVAGFTNLTLDHLDYHKDMRSYLNAKKRLFTDILEEKGTAVINADIDEYKALTIACLDSGKKVMSYGYNGTDIKLIEATPDTTGQNLKIEVLGKKYDIHLPLAGVFQSMNALCALGMAISLGAPIEKTIYSLQKLKGAPGRLEYVLTTKKGGSIYIDFAHTPDALETILQSLKPHTKNKLHVVYGCGGDRDATKRPIMGEIAERLADFSIVTDDNPRTEDAKSIRQEILAKNPSAKEIGDRRKAIRYAIEQLEEGDLLVLAGKGHETGQILNGYVEPFNDKIEVISAIEELEMGRKKRISYKNDPIITDKEITKVTSAVVKKSFETSKIVTNHEEIEKGDLFIAIETKDYNGHKYVKEALTNGAIAAIVHKADIEIAKEDLIIVGDTNLALENIANHQREKSPAKFILISGDNTRSEKSDIVNKITSNNGLCEKFTASDIISASQNLANINPKADFILVETTDNKTGINRALSALVKPNINIITDSENKKLLDNLSETLSGVKMDGAVIIDASSSDNFKKMSFNANICGIKNIKSFTNKEELEQTILETIKR